MATNPFFNAEESEPEVVETEESTDAATQSDDSESEETIEEEAADLFSEEDEADNLFEDTEPEEGTPDSIPYKRFQKVIGERNTLRESQNELEQSLAEVQGRLDELHGYKDVLSEKYQGFKDPLGQAAWDADFVSSAEALAKTDPEVQAALQKVLQHVETGQVTPTMTTPTETPEPKVDPRVEKIIQRDTKNQIQNTLGPDVKPGFVNVFTDYAMANLDGDATETTITNLAKEFIKEKGFSKEDVFKAVDAPSKRKPATSTQGKAATSDSSDTETPERETPQGTREERLAKWNSNREKVLRTIS